MVRLWRNWNPCAVLTGLQNGPAIVENRLMVPQKVNTDLPSGPPITPRNIPKEVKMNTQKSTRTHMCLSTLLLTARSKVHWWMNRQYMMYPCEGILFSHKKGKKS